MSFKPSHNILRMVRMYAQWTQAQMAERLGVRPSYVSELETGKRPVGLSVLRRYAEALQVPLSSLIFFMEEQEPGDEFHPSSGFLQTKALAFLDWMRSRAEIKDLETTPDSAENRNGQNQSES